MIDNVTVRRLLEPADPAITLYVPLLPEQRDLRAQAALFQDLIEQARQMLERDGVDLRRREQLLEPVLKLAQETDLARHRDPTLAVFSCDEFTLAEPLPTPLPAFVSVAAEFHVKPMLPLLVRNRRFYILALSKAKVALYAASPFGCAQVPLEVLPPDAQAELDGLPAAEAGQMEARRQALLNESPKRICHAVKAALAGDQAPVVVVGDPQVAGHFIAQANLPQLVLEPVAFNPFSCPPSMLVEKAMERIDPQQEPDAATEQMQARFGSGDASVSLRLEEILSAAAEGRVDMLLVDQDETLWGQYTPGEIVSAHGHRAPHDEDLLNHAVVQTLRHGGRAYAQPRDRLPMPVPAAALLRF